MLCSRSASFTSSTRMSSLSASRNLRRFSAARSFSDWASILRQLGHAVDQARDVLAEMLLDLFRGGERVLDRVVEDRGGDRLVVELQVGEDPGDFDRMAEIGVARGAHLRAVRLHREDVGAVDQPLVRVGIVGADLLDQFILSQHVPKMGRRGAIVQARKEGRGRAREETRPRGSLLCGERRVLRRLRRGVAAIELGGAQRAAVDDEAVDSPGVLGERLAEHQRAALVGRALAGGGAAVPDDVAGDEAARWRGRSGLAE